MPPRYTYTQVQDIFTQHKCILISEKYENQLGKLEYTASCGHTHNISLKEFIYGIGIKCRNCALEIPTYEDVVKKFLDKNCLVTMTKEEFIANYKKNIKDLQSKLEERRQILLEQHKNLKKTTKENEFLEEVAQDYNKYYGFIKKQKEEQIAALEIINNYLENIILESRFAETSLNEAKKEQSQIIERINNIRKELEDIME